MSNPDKNLMHPKYWSSWLALGLMRLFSLLPYRALMAIGTFLGKTAGAVLPSRRKIVSTNIAIAFPELNTEDRKKLCRQHFVEVGKGAMELTMAWFWPDKKLAQLAEFEGLEHLQHSLKKKQGVILLSGHFTTLEICTRMLSTQFDMSAMHSPTKDPVFAWAMRRYRGRQASHVLDQSDVRGMVKALRGGAFVWYAPDQSRKTPFSVLAPFFGKPAWTVSALGRLASMGKASVMHFEGIRNTDKNRPAYRMIVHPPSEDLLTEKDIEIAATKVNALIESTTEQAPAQYFWLHRRWKDRAGATGYPYGEM